MTDRVITLVLSERAYESARRIAETNAQPIEQILQQRLESVLPSSLPLDEKTELSALKLLSDDALWTIAREQMPRDQQERLRVLLALNKRSDLMPSETSELDDLLSRSDQVMLRKAEAAALLTERGYTVIPKEMAAPHE